MKAFEGPLILGSPVLQCGKYPDAPGVCNDYTQFYKYNGDADGWEQAGDFVGRPKGGCRSPSILVRSPHVRLERRVGHEGHRSLRPARARGGRGDRRNRDGRGHHVPRLGDHQPRHRRHLDGRRVQLLGAQVGLLPRHVRHRSGGGGDDARWRSSSACSASCSCSARCARRRRSPSSSPRSGSC